jgi:thiamine-monophosphate kinase
VEVPIGDDLAVLKWAADDLLLVGVDQVLDGVHFDSAVHSPRAIGRKAMNRNLSDCAAMACLPAAAVTTFALPKRVGEDYAKELYEGMREAGAKFDCPIVGGDTGSWGGRLVVTVTVLGRSDKVKPVTRSGARQGDHIYVTGPLGGSILGRHMTFEPRVAVARALAGSYPITSMIDLSDGLSRDLGHLSRQSGVGASVSALRVPVHADAIEMRRDGHSPLEHALHDGEDYELLFTSPADIPVELATCIGRMSEAYPPGHLVLIRPDGSRKPLLPKGWEHSL